jgi:hypothetical protein
MGVLVERLQNQKELLFQESLEESFNLLKKLDNKDLEQIGERNFNQLTQTSWEDFANFFEN